MGKQKLKGKDLRKIGFNSNKTISLAIGIVSKYYKHNTKSETLDLLVDISSSPKKYINDEQLKPLANAIMGTTKKEVGTTFEVRAEPNAFQVFGKKLIDQNTVNQMSLAMRLPIAEKGALMPDAHVGYGLPIGGVLATKNEVVPYGIGLDIGCRMALGIFDVPTTFIKKNGFALKRALLENTFFGIGNSNAHNNQHEILDRKEFKSTELLKKLHGKACVQLGTSGSGNHFVEFGEVILNENNHLNIPAGSYLGLLSHSGSRGLGAAIANYYVRVAMDLCRLPKGYQHLAWLDLDKAEGKEYWEAMNLAGDYAKACHDVIHHKLGKAIGARTLIKVENHHNFAWRELQNDGSELIVHRKGATPAKQGELGIIPANMTAPGYIVSGKGDSTSLSSASHGAGRKLSRQKAKNSLTGSEMRKHLKQKRVSLIGGSVDEAPMAYKNIESIMQSQDKLVNIEGLFIPKIVRMDKN